MHILYVDDSPTDGAIFVRLAKKHGHSVALAYDGTDGLETLQKGQYDKAVLDYNIPGICGDILAKCVSPYVNGNVCYLTGERPHEESQYEFFSKSGLEFNTHSLWHWINRDA